MALHVSPSTVREELIDLCHWIAWGHAVVVTRSGRPAFLVRRHRLGDSGPRRSGRCARASVDQGGTRGLAQLIWDGRLSAPDKVEAPSPVIYQLATHDLLMAILQAPSSREVYLAGWAPERAIALGFRGYLRPDALAVIGDGDRAVELFIERDLGTERGAILAAKARTYSGYRSADEVPMNVGFVVESARRGALRRWRTVCATG